MGFYYKNSYKNKKGLSMNTKHLLLLALCAVAPFTSHAMENHQQLLKRGILIAIEGIDGSGKTTLAQAVHARLEEEGFQTVLTREPGDSALGKQIREIVQTQKTPISPKAEFLLFAADRAEHFDKLIIPALKNNYIVISDRLADSSLVYQGYGRGLFIPTLRAINSFAMSTPEDQYINQHTPDITIYVRVPVKVALERCKKRSSLSTFEQGEFLESVAQGFEKIYKSCIDHVAVDGTLSPEVLATQVCDKIRRWIEAQKIFKSDTYYF
jgi:dTMP kinase